MKKAVILATLIFSSTLAYSEEYSCHRDKPDFYQDVFNEYHGKTTAFIGAQIHLLDYLDKPYDSSLILDWIQAYQIDKFCVYGDYNNKEISAKTKGILVIPSEYSNTGKKQALVFSTTFTYDPDRGQYRSSGGNNTILDLTGSFIPQQAQE